MKQEVKEWFERLDRFNAEPFPDCEQPLVEAREIFDEHKESEEDNEA